jgi:hypothetical protein
MRNDQPAASALFGCESGLSEPEIGLEPELEQDKWQNLHGARVASRDPNNHFNTLS